MDSSIILPEATDPSVESNTVKVYGKEVAGVTELFALSSDGTISQISNVTPAVPGAPANSVQTNDGVGGFAGSANLTYDGATLSSIGGSPAIPALQTVGQVHFDNSLSEQVVEFEPDLYSMNIKTGASLDPGPGYISVIEAGQVVASEYTDSTFSTLNAAINLAPASSVRTMDAGAVTPTIQATDGVVDKPLNLVVGELQINGAAGAAGEVLTSQGAGAAPIWAAGGGGSADVAKVSVRVATAGALPANTFSAGVLTATAGGLLNATGIDGVTTLALGDRVLVKDEGSGEKNLIYTITDLGSTGTGPQVPSVPAPPTYPGALLTCGSGGTYATLSAAVAAAATGDRIQILPGTITEVATVNINKPLEVFGTGATCIVSRSSTTAVITVSATDAYLHDFAIINDQQASLDPGGQSACVNADTMNRSLYGGSTGLYFANLACTMPKVGIFVSGTDWVITDCTFTPNALSTTAGTTLRAVFTYGSEGTSYIAGNTVTTSADNARMTAIYLNTRVDGIAPNWEGGYKGALVIRDNTIVSGGGAPRSYIDATSIYHQSGPQATLPPTGEFDLYIANNNFSLNHQSSPCVIFGRASVTPLSFFNNFVVTDNSFGARDASASQKGAIFWTNTSGAAVGMGQFVGGFYGANNTIAAMTLPATNTSIMLDGTLLMVRENATYNAPSPLLTLVPTTPPSPWAMTWADDFDSNPEVTRGVFTSVNEGTANTDTSWIVLTADPISVGVTALSWGLFGQTGYAAATPADWAAPAPTSIAAAIDRLAAAVAGLLGSPIP